MPTNRYGFNARVAVRSLKAVDPKLARLMERAGPFRLELDGAETPFESLLEAIVYQQLHGKAAAAIFGRVKAVFGNGAFPAPQQFLDAKDETLRSAGLSRQKIAAIRDLAAKTIDGTVPTLEAIRQMRDAEIIERLVAVRGIGVWTAEMLLIFHLGRPDVLPIHDYGILQGHALTHGLKKLPKPKQLLKFGERWRPYRTVASWYLWQAVRLKRKEPIGMK